MAEIIAIPVGALEVNCYIVWDRATLDGVIIDPGADAGEIEAAVKENGVKVRCVLNTHGHFDHVGANKAMKAAFKVPVAIHPDDAPLMADAHEHGIFFGVETPKQAAPDILLEDGQSMEFGPLKFKVIHTPGHTRGGVCLYLEGAKALFTGDTLFAGSVGRTDFEGGSMDELMSSISRKLLSLDDKVMVLPGHGPSSTIGEERMTNPYLAGIKR
ncbi:MAG: MBL fold metallo-hydrolase [Deltaproteobacteria bacterium]|nr:MBL fold metallo-hydrolase [Deltaproteobacteria bacterium]